MKRTPSLAFTVFIVLLAFMRDTFPVSHGESCPSLHANRSAAQSHVNHIDSQDNNITLVGRWPYGSCMAVCVKDDYAYIGNGTVMTILDISDPASPKKVGEIETPSVVRDIFIYRHYAYVANGWSGLRVIDVSDPSAPVEVYYKISGHVRKVTASRGVLYVCMGHNVAIYNITAPSEPELEEIISTDQVTRDISLYTTSRTYLCLANARAGLRIFDVTQLNNIFETGSLDVQSTRDVFVSGDYAYIVDYSSLHTVDLTNPSEPVLLGSCYTAYQFCNIYVSDGYAYVTDELYGGFWIIDVSNPTNPAYTGYYHPGEGGSEGVVVRDKVAYVAHGSAGLNILDVSVPSNPKEMARFGIGGDFDSIVVFGDYAYTLCGSSFYVFDVSNPALPRYHASIFIDINYLLDVYVSGHYAYVTGMYGLWIIDISTPDNPAIVGAYHTEKDAWSVYVKNNHAYLGCSDGLHVVDVSDKSNPTESCFYKTDDKVLKVDIEGSYAYVAVSRSGLQILDISTPDNPVPVGHLPITQGNMGEVYVSGTYAYAGLSSAGFMIIDVSRPENPVEVNSYKGEFYYARDLCVSNNFAYVTDGIHGLRIINVGMPESLKETACFSTGDFAHDVFVTGNLVYIAASDAGLYILRHESAYEKSIIPSSISLLQNHPNPFNASTCIRFELSVPERVTLTLFDTNGRYVETLIEDVLYNSGTHGVPWTAGSLPTGVYLVRLKAGDYVETKKIILLK